MRTEKWKFNDEEIDLTIFDDEDIETNDEELENTKDLSNILLDEEDKNE